MIIRKYLIAVFIVFSLSISYQPVSYYSKEKGSVVLILNYEKDDFTDSFINTNENKRKSILISLTLKVMLYNKEQMFSNSS